VDRRETMNKLKLLGVAALAGATVGTGALAAAPSASTAPSLQPPRKGKTVSKPLPLLRIRFDTVSIT
jgi:hypothetical protein